jgi:3-methyladenine DNA glycosylase AlkD
LKTAEAREAGRRIAALVGEGQVDEAYALLSSILSERTPFAMLRYIGAPVAAAGSQVSIDRFLDLIAAAKTEGGWVVIQSTLAQMLGRDLAGAFARCRAYVVAADVWYAADTLGEGVVGQALVSHFRPALELLDPWRKDEDAWVRRAVGTGVHYWAKRSRGAAELLPQAGMLLAFLEPMFGERDIRAVKGVGWGLKTMGRIYPDLMAEWLPGQVGRRHRSLMLRKAMKGLSEEQREWVMAASGVQCKT